jgi:diguanylate cyclase (GGDEF)-like protein
MFASGYSSVHEILDVRHLDPQVIVCANDLMALGVCNALSDRGIRIPFDIAVTGCDDIQLERTISHGITTVHQSFSRLGYTALERLHGHVTGNVVFPGTQIKPDVRIRASCGCVDFRSRNQVPCYSCVSANVRPDVTILNGLVSAALDNQERSALKSAWIRIIRAGFAVNRPIYEFEEILHFIRTTGAGSVKSAELDVLLDDLYAILFEECGQQAFITNSKDEILSWRLRELIDRLNDEVSRDTTLFGHDAIFRNIVELLGARRFYLVLFEDFRKIGSNPILLFAGGSEVSDDEWKPGPDSWFPPDVGNLVVNLVQYEEDKFGYFFIDNDISASFVFEYLRFRFGVISKNLFNLNKIQRLNSELTREIAIRVSAEQKLKDALSLVEQLSIKDELTGLYNRRGFFMFGEQNIKYFIRQNSSFFVLYADLDGLKAINDQWGHTEGDFALQQAGAAFHDTIRDSDVVARIGGDEFTMLVSKANPPDFNEIRKRIFDSFERKNREIQKPWVLSVSIGHYYAVPECKLTLAEMLALADADLYREKARKKSAPT